MRYLQGSISETDEKWQCMITDFLREIVFLDW